jgi:hypothetical protein
MSDLLKRGLLALALIAAPAAYAFDALGSTGCPCGESCCCGDDCHCTGDTCRCADGHCDGCCKGSCPTR